MIGTIRASQQIPDPFNTLLCNPMYSGRLLAPSRAAFRILIGRGEGTGRGGVEVRSQRSRESGAEVMDDSN